MKPLFPACVHAPPSIRNSVIKVSASSRLSLAGELSVASKEN
ncbi:hypothetical protein [Lacinutrix sp. 5H-3-7-4]